MIGLMLRDSPYRKRKMLRAKVTVILDCGTFDAMLVALGILLLMETLLRDLLEGKASSAEP